METVLKEAKSKSHKEFEKLLSEDLNNRILKEGEIITGTVSSISKKHIFVDISAKSEGIIRCVISLPFNTLPKKPLGIL